MYTKVPLSERNSFLVPRPRFSKADKQAPSGRCGARSLPGCPIVTRFEGRHRTHFFCLHLYLVILCKKKRIPIIVRWCANPWSVFVRRSCDVFFVRPSLTSPILPAADAAAAQVLLSSATVTSLLVFFFFMSASLCVPGKNRWTLPCPIGFLPAAARILPSAFTSFVLSLLRTSHVGVYLAVSLLSCW